MTATYAEGDTVVILIAMTTSEGSRIASGTIGTLMTDMGDGDWLVYIPAKGSPCLRAGEDFE
jgi:hypothetical protein